MQKTKKYFILAYYGFTHIENPLAEVAKHHAFFQNRDAKGRIYISHEGINGQMSAQDSDAQAYMDWMKQDERFQEIDFKIHHYREHAFPRMTVKMRKQLVAIDVPVDMAETGERVSPKRWKEMLEERTEETLLMDVRNDYEWKIGHFDGAVLPSAQTFREFPAYAQKLKETVDLEKTKVMMYCTGGIRCELYSALLKQEGFKNVYQLDGGVIGYGLFEGNKHWQGKLFVFDDRLAVSIDEKEPSLAISHCSYCEELSDTYYNCANMDCNELFLCCPGCAEKLQGCCQSACREAPRLRPFQKEERPKPFRKGYHYACASCEDGI
jgi:UPF0176 protein